MQAAGATITSIFSMRPEGEMHPLTLSEQIAENIYLAIVEGRYKFGERIREEEISRRFQVSRGPVREALRILEKDSVVSILPHRGAHVTELTAQEVRDIFAIRKALIGLAIRGFDRLSSSDLDDMTQMIARMDAIAAQPDNHEEYVRASARLHLFMASKTSNRRLYEMIRSLARQTFRYTIIALSGPQAREKSAAGWTGIIRSLERGDWDEAAKQAEDLIDRSCNSAILQLESTTKT
jgi:DNA-binding GntR family transcriptional regulator